MICHRGDKARSRLPQACSPHVSGMETFKRAWQRGLERGTRGLLSWPVHSCQGGRAGLGGCRVVLGLGALWAPSPLYTSQEWEVGALRARR